MLIESNGGHAAFDPRYAQRSLEQGSLRTNASSIQARRSQQASIEVVTAEGDRVSLQAGSRLDVSVERYETQLRTAAGRSSTQAERLSIVDSSSLTIEVEGDLNDEELADIQALIEDFERLGSSLLSGTLEPGLQLGGSLASAQGELSVTEEFVASFRQATLAVGRTPEAFAPRGAEVADLIDQLEIDDEDDADDLAPVQTSGVDPASAAPRPVQAAELAEASAGVAPSAPAQAEGPATSPARPAAAASVVSDEGAARSEVRDGSPARDDAPVRRRDRGDRRLEPGRIQRQAARRAADIVRRRPERADALQAALPRVADRFFDRLARRFGAEPAEAARSAFQTALGEELARATAEVGPETTEARSAIRRNPYEAFVQRSASTQLEVSLTNEVSPIETAEAADDVDDDVDVEEGREADDVDNLAGATTGPLKA